jgi:transcriptional regulator with XRE-family HTH domain
MKRQKIAKIIGSRIKEIRQAHGYTSERLAYENSMSKGYLSDVENGKKVPSIDFLCRIAASLDVEPWEFLKPGRNRK